MVQAHRASPADHFQLPYAVENSQFQLFATAASTTTPSVDRAQQPSSKTSLDRRAPRAARSLVLVGRVQGQLATRHHVGLPVAHAYGARRRALDSLSHRAPVGTIEREAA